jgi:hypothetical protein
VKTNVGDFLTFKVTLTRGEERRRTGDLPTKVIHLFKLGCILSKIGFIVFIMIHPVVFSTVKYKTKYNIKQKISMP